MPNVLIVDDHPEVLEMLRTILESRGYFTFLAADPVTALDATDHVQFDAALIDLELPQISGLELVREMQRRRAGLDRSLGVCVMTGVPDPDLWQAAARAGAVAVIEKPFSTADLLAQVERLCAASECAELSA